MNAKRITDGDQVYHVLNRGAAGTPLFRSGGDFLAFERLLEGTVRDLSMRLLEYSIMENHWHLVVYPRHDDDLVKFAYALAKTHAQRWNAYHERVGQGRVYQGPYRSFMVEPAEESLSIVCRYAAANPLRAGLVDRAENWRWSSAWRLVHGSDADRALLSPWPVDRPRGWAEVLNQPLTDEELARVRRSTMRGDHFGSDEWVDRMCRAYDWARTG